MNTDYTADRGSTAWSRIRRALALLAVLLALLAVPAVAPQLASAQRISEWGLIRACSNAGGQIFYNFNLPSMRNYEVSCYLPSGTEIYCLPVTGTFGRTVDCAGI